MAKMKSFALKIDRLIEIKADISSNFFAKPNVFETIFVYKSSPIFLTEHLERLNRSLQNIMENPFAVLLPGETTFADLIMDILRRHPGSNYLRITIMKSGEIYFSLSDEVNYPSENYISGISVKVIDKRIQVDSGMIGIKGSHLKKNVDLRRKLKQEGYDEGLLVNSNGYISEGCVSNVFWLKGGSIYTPAPQNCLLPGIVRQKTIEIAGDQGLETFEGDYVIENLKEADEAFLTNSLMGILPVRQITFVSTDVKIFRDRRINSFLMEKYKDRIEEEVNAFL